LAALFLLGGTAGSLWFALRLQVGIGFVLLLLLAVVLFAPLPLIIYRGYALLNAAYTLERDGLRIRWGLRAEDIPLPEIEWVRPAAELGFHLVYPPFIWPGAVLGARIQPDLGPVEFMASELDDLLLIATAQKIYAVSPEDARGFVRSFQRAMEMGSLEPLAAASVQPAAFARRVWDDRPARIIVLLGIGLTALLWILVGSLIPGRSSVTLGFDAFAQPLPAVPAEQLLLLPVLAILFAIINLATGVYFYRRESERPVAFTIWIAGVFAALVFIGAAIFSL
jgi:hypothetical protein